MLTGPHWSSQGLTGFTGPHGATLVFTGLHWASLGLTQPHWASWGSTKEDSLPLVLRCAGGHLSLGHRPQLVAQPGLPGSCNSPWPAQGWAV